MPMPLSVPLCLNSPCPCWIKFCGIALVMLSDGGCDSPWGLDVALDHHQSLLYPCFPTFINSNSGGKRGTIALSWKWDPKIESVILVLFSFSRKARKDYGIMAGHGKRPLTPLVYWLVPMPTPLSRSRTMLHMPAPPACPHLARTCQLMTSFCLMDESRYSNVGWWKNYSDSFSYSDEK